MDVKKIFKTIDKKSDNELCEMMEKSFMLKVTASELMELHASLKRYLKTPDGIMSDVLSDGHVEKLMLRIRKLITNHLGTYGINIEED